MFRAAALILLAVAVVYGRALGFGFVYDDRALIELNNSLSQLATLPTALGHDLFYFAEGVRPSPYWRPVITLSYYLDHWVGGGNPAWFHLHNLLVLCAGGLGAWRLLNERWGSTQALFWALLFVVHPLQVEAAVNVAARTDSYCAAFGIWAVVYAHRRPGLSLGLVLLACGSKEIGFLLPLVCWAWWGGQRYAWKAPAVGVVAWLVIRAGVVWGWGVESVGASWASVAHTGGRGLSLLLQLVFPLQAAHGALMAPPGLAMDLFGWTVFLGLGWVAWRWRTRQPGVSAGIVLAIFPVLASAGLAVGVPRVSQAFLVVPLLGMILVLQACFERQRSILKPMGGILLLCAAIGMQRIGMWESDASLFSESHRLRPADGEIRLNLARTVVDDDSERALALLDGALSLGERGQREAASVRGRALLNLGRQEDAITTLLEAVASEPESAWATGTACVLLAGTTREQAESTCRLAVRLLPEDADVANAMGVVLGRAGAPVEAYTWFERALRLAPGRAAFRENLQAAESAVERIQGSSDELP